MSANKIGKRWFGFKSERRHILRKAGDLKRSLITVSDLETRNIYSHRSMVSARMHTSDQWYTNAKMTLSRKCYRVIDWLLVPQTWPKVAALEAGNCEFRLAGGLWTHVGVSMADELIDPYPWLAWAGPRFSELPQLPKLVKFATLPYLPCERLKSNRHYEIRKVTNIIITMDRFIICDLLTAVPSVSLRSARLFGVDGNVLAATPESLKPLK